MMKLYWKVKIDGKWTFRVARMMGWQYLPDHPRVPGAHLVVPYLDEYGNDSEGALFQEIRGGE